MNNFNKSSEKNRLLRSGKFVDITKYLPKGYVKNGTVDYTNYLQKALNENRKVIMPNFPILINDIGLDIPSQTTVIFENSSKLLLSPSAKANYELIRIHRKSDIVIFSPTIIGDRKNHRGNLGEWGMGISIKSSRNIVITNANISDCWGDGVYIGQSLGITNSNISLKYGLIDNNRRNGISVISANGLTIQNMVVSNTNGTAPQAGIDFEPNANNEVLKNITIKNVYTFNNNSQGIFYCLNKLNGGSDSVGIVVDTHLDNYSKGAIGIMNMAPGRLSKESLKGRLVFRNIEGRNNRVHFRIFDKSDLDNMNIEVSPKVKTGFKMQGTSKNLILSK
ncbi:right-handed parallel beta-helix repeat-containing protein [Sphingobacterium sp. NGMCC 1.201703]|uniref:right-handed parallel beta-helix repeat-containing protein n=1 Tax=Sphingobacterium sp. NGMCC 1.201703 TaxID=3388657 RepID=UPI0039FBBF2A